MGTERGKAVQSDETPAALFSSLTIVTKTILLVGIEGGITGPKRQTIKRE